MALWGPYSRLGTDTKNDKPLPSLPSPTLTNPDLVLPDEPFSQTLSSPLVPLRQNPTISYLRQQTDDYTRRQNRQSLDVEERQLSGYHGPTERRGLLSRKMLLVRSETGGGNTPDDEDRTPTATEGTGLLASSPLLKDHLAVAAPPVVRRASSSSLDSDEMAKMPDFLAKYKSADATDDDATDSEIAEAKAYKEERKAKEEEEQVSAMLSQRAEEILANAKKRLNLMEGNLRGARDLVAPLTAANLKRATSLSYSFGSPSMAYTHRRLDSLAYDSDPYNPSRRMLHSQQSSPAMRSEFFSHARGGSEELEQRPYTAFSSRSPHMARSPRFPVKPSEPASALRTARSFDALGVSKLEIPDTTAGQQRSKDSPSSNLEPVSEDEAAPITSSVADSTPANNRLTVGLGVSTARSISSSSATTSEDLRDQMESLKGRISSLRERAKEDRLRRASNNNLRNPSPFNNAATNAPEFWYTQPSNYGISQIDTNVDTTEPERHREDSPTTPHAGHLPWRSSGPTGSRNAFAEKAAKDHGLAAQSSASGGSSPVDKRQNRYSAGNNGNNRGSGGTAILASSKKPAQNRDVPGAFDQDQFNSSDEYISDQPSDDTSLMPNSEPYTPEPNGASSSGEDSLEEDYDDLDVDELGELEEDDTERPEFIAHEDREDAFDYEHFFLHSAMGSYHNDSSSESDLDSVSSAGTARAPVAQHDESVEYDEENDFDEEVVDDYAEETATPGTPDALKKIEARLSQVHGRTISTESVETINTFATATEGRETPAVLSRSTSSIERPVTPIESARPGTAIRDGATNFGGIAAKPAVLTAIEADDASDRADSGVGGLSQSHGQTTPRSTPGPGSDGMPRSTPSSPARTVVQQRHLRTQSLEEHLQPQDPTTLAFKTLLEPEGKPLGLKDKAVIFGLIESLRSVCVRLQKEDEAEKSQVNPEQSAQLDAGSDASELRKRLEDARKVLEGLNIEKPVDAAPAAVL